MNYCEQAVATTQQILDDEYYLNRFFVVLEHNGVTAEGLLEQSYTATTVVKVFNDFWTALPDSRSIRTGVFFQICDIAEGIFDEEFDKPSTAVPSDVYVEMHRQLDENAA